MTADWLLYAIIGCWACALILAIIWGWFAIGARGETPDDISDLPELPSALKISPLHSVGDSREA